MVRYITRLKAGEPRGIGGSLMVDRRTRCPAYFLSRSACSSASISISTDPTADTSKRSGRSAASRFLIRRRIEGFHLRAKLRSDLRLLGRSFSRTRGSAFTLITSSPCSKVRLALKGGVATFELLEVASPETKSLEKSVRTEPPSVAPMRFTTLIVLS